MANVSILRKIVNKSDYVLLQERNSPLFLISVQEMNLQELCCMFRYQVITIGTQQVQNGNTEFKELLFRIYWHGVKSGDALGRISC